MEILIVKPTSNRWKDNVITDLKKTEGGCGMDSHDHVMNKWRAVVDAVMNIRVHKACINS